jgi:SAM-dependent methyltransferase
VSEIHACRSCGSTRVQTFLDLGNMPLPTALVTTEQLDRPEPRFPLEVAHCADCSLVQITEDVPPQQLFVDNYLYFSSFSDELLRHSRAHALALIEQRGLDSDSLVVELASNDGYLLKNFVDAGIPVQGVDPAPGQAEAANAAGVPTIAEFFGLDLAKRIRGDRGPADVVIANNVMAHIPDPNDFVAGIAHLLADDGLLTVENPYVRDLVEKCEFDTIYHEHFFYHSCTSIDSLVRRHGMRLVDVEYFPDLHGGTLRWHVAKQGAVSETASRYLSEEREQGIVGYGYYADFGKLVESVREELLLLLGNLRRQGNRIAAYGAAAKGSTLANYVGIGPDLVDFVVDRNVHKQGKHTPGTHIPVRSPEALLEEQPDYVVMFTWNFRDEILRQQHEYVARGGKFIVPLPWPEVVP